MTNREDARRINKATSPHLIKEAAANLMKFDVSNRAVFSFIIGFPWHTLDDCLNTLSFLTNLILDYGIRVYLQWYWAIPGSAIWRMLEAESRVDIEITNIPGFYRSPEWFYSIRRITPDDLRLFDSRIGPVQLCLTLHRGDLERSPLEYSPPDLE